MRVGFDQNLGDNTGLFLEDHYEWDGDRESHQGGRKGGYFSLCVKFRNCFKNNQKHASWKVEHDDIFFAPRVEDSYFLQGEFLPTCATLEMVSYAFWGLNGTPEKSWCRCCKFYEDIVTTWESHRSWLQQFLWRATWSGAERNAVWYHLPLDRGRRVSLSKRLLVAADFAIVHFFWFTLRSNLNPHFWFLLVFFFEAGGTFNWKLLQQESYIYIIIYKYISIFLCIYIVAEHGRLSGFFGNFQSMHLSLWTAKEPFWNVSNSHVSV